MPLEGSFTLEFDQTPEQAVRVRVDSPLGSAGPVLINDGEADRLASLVTAMFELLHAAQLRERR